MPRRPPSTPLLVAHQNALAALARRLVADRTGGVLEAAVETLKSALGARGGLAYRAEGGLLVLVADEGLPPAARQELSRLPLDGAFVAQRAGRELHTVVEDGPAEGSLHAMLAVAGWKVLAAAPMTVGRSLRGVLLVGFDAHEKLERDTIVLLEGVAAMATLSMERERTSQRDRDERGADELAARFATVGMVSTAGALDIAVPLSAMMVQLEALERTLGALRPRVDELGEQSEALDDAEALVADMGDAVRRALGIASHLLELSRKSRTAPVDLRHALDASLTLLGGKLHASSVALTVTGDDEPLLVDGRAESLQALLVQIVLHALEMCSASGAREGGIRIHLSTAMARHVVSIETNAGDPSRRHTFDAFVRRQVHGPAGLSLSLAAQAAVAHDGHIEIGTSEDGGAHIDVVLPVSRTRPRPRGRLAEEPLAGNSIVVVGDDEALVTALGPALPQHRIHTAETVKEAAALLASLRPPPEMVLCEVSLPDGTGTELHESVEQSLRGRFVFSTKGVLSAEVADYLRASSCPTLLRPIAPEEIRLLLSEDAIAGAPTLGGVRRRDTEPHISIPPWSTPREKRSARSAARRRTATQTDTPIAIRSKPPSGTED